MKKNLMEQVQEAREENRMMLSPEEVPMDFFYTEESKSPIEQQTEALVKKTIQEFEKLGRDQIILSVTNREDFDNEKGHTQGCMVCGGQFAYQHAVRILKDQVQHNPMVLMLLLSDLRSAMK